MNERRVLHLAMHESLQGRFQLGARVLLVAGPDAGRVAVVRGYQDCVHAGPDSIVLEFPERTAVVPRAWAKEIE